MKTIAITLDIFVELNYLHLFCQIKYCFRCRHGIFHGAHVYARSLIALSRAIAESARRIVFFEMLTGSLHDRAITVRGDREGEERGKNLSSRLSPRESVLPVVIGRGP